MFACEARRPRPRRARRLSALGAWLVLLVASLAAAEDTIRVKGDTLRGEVVELVPDGLRFSPIHGDGVIVVPWADVEGVETESSFSVLYGDHGEASGRLLGVDGGAVLVGHDRASAQRIDIGTLFLAYRGNGFGEDPMERLRSRLRHWTAHFDLGASYTDATSDQTSGFLGLRIDRERDPTRFLLEAAGRYATEKEQGQDRSVTENNIYGFTRGEVDLTDRIYNYASLRGTHDAEQNLALRLEPRAGVGYHLIQSADFNLSTDVGAAWIYEQYYGAVPIAPGSLIKRSRGRDNFWTIAFGAQADAQLPYGATWGARAEYLPAVDGWTREYLMRGETWVEFPLLEWLSFRVSALDEYINAPPSSVQRNRFTTTGSLSFRFP